MTIFVGSRIFIFTFVPGLSDQFIGTSFTEYPNLFAKSNISTSNDQPFILHLERMLFALLALKILKPHWVS